jgi:putative CocE/NonD family hydrolase
MAEIAAPLEIAPPETVAMRTRDGVRLDADVWRPARSGCSPVLLMRQPYGRRIASTVTYAHPSWYAAHGYIVVIQDVRGRGSSEGEFQVFAREAADGADAVDWAASLPAANGAVGMYGFSYQGTAQLLAAAMAGPALKALAPAMIGWDLRTDWAYENDAFCLQANLGWATQIGAETARLAGDAAAFAAFHAASRALPWSGPRPARPDFIERHGRHTHYHAWLARRDDDAYWRSISPKAQAADAAVPMLFVGGWFDSHLPGTLAAFRHYASRAAAPTRLIVGPWPHMPWGRRLAGIDFGPEAASDIDRIQLRWFDHWLKGAVTGARAEPAIRLFEMGGNAWQDFAAWPATGTPLYLAGNGLASIDERSGRLVAAVPPGTGVEHLVHDPWRPAPTVGGAFGTPPGPADRSAIDARGDVLTFTTEPFAHPVRLAGDVAARLWITADAPSFDVSCTLSRVTRSGQVLPLAQGYRHLPAGAPRDPVFVPMRATCASLLPGEALRLSLAAACFPAYPVNPGTGRAPTDASFDEARIVTLAIRHGGAAASAVMLPLVPP